MRAMFEPIGAESRWRTVYALLRERHVNDVVTYEEMGAVLDLDPITDRPAIRGSVGRAAQEFEVVDLHAIAPVRNVGYRIVEAPEHLGLAQNHQRKSSRQLKRGRGKIEHVDLNELSGDQRVEYALAARLISMQMDFNRRTDIRLKNHDEAIRSMVVKTERSDSEIAALRARLEKLETSDE